MPVRSGISPEGTARPRISRQGRDEKIVVPGFVPASGWDAVGRSPLVAIVAGG
jgi:hypothetical protein